MSAITVVYPRFFTSAHKGKGGVVVSRGDLGVELLYDMLVDKAHNHGTWAFQSAVIDQALRLFGDFHDWAEAQRKDPHITGYNARFIEDTLKFIETGERDLCHENWMALVNENPHAAQLAGAHERAAPRLWQSPSTVTALQKWCSHPNGVEDLLCTLHLLFGRARSDAGRLIF